MFSILDFEFKSYWSKTVQLTLFAIKVTSLALVFSTLNNINATGYVNFKEDRSFASKKLDILPKQVLDPSLKLTNNNILFAYGQNSASQPNTLNEALEFYGFTTAQQKQALRYLLKAAEVNNVDALLDTKRKNTDELARAILDLVRFTQQNFTIRSGAQERWEVQASNWMQDEAKQTKILEALEILGMMNAMPPKFASRDAICILGASRSVMSARLKYASNLHAKNELPAKWLIMLAGERYVTADKNGIAVDGSEQSLKEIAAKLNKTIATLTETDLMQIEYANSKLYSKFPGHTVLLDTPRRELPRPTTETTVTELCLWLKDHPEVRKLSFVSNQPHVDYQKAIIAQVFEKNNINVEYEVIGPEYDISIVNNTSDKINYIIQALGSKIWAMTPEVLDRIGLDMSNPELRAEYLELYKKQPLIYNNLNAKYVTLKASR